MSAFQHTNARGIPYYLHGQVVNLNGGRTQQIYFFAKDVRADKAVTEMPAGYEVVETERTGLPVLKKAKVEAE